MRFLDNFYQFILEEVQSYDFYLESDDPFLVKYRFEDVEGALDEKANVIRTFTATLTGGDWNNSTKQQTITEPFVAIQTTSIVWVSPAPADYEKYVLAGVRAVSQGTDTITFQCETLPINTTAGNINVVIVSQYEPNL
jgi:hypothetical protein